MKVFYSFKYFRRIWKGLIQILKWYETAEFSHNASSPGFSSMTGVLLLIQSSYLSLVCFENLFGKYILYYKIILYWYWQGLSQNCIIKHTSSINLKINVQITILNNVRQCDNQLHISLLGFCCPGVYTNFLTFLPFSEHWNLEL